MQNVMWKMMVKKWPPELEKISFGSHFGLSKPWFFRDFGYKNEDGFLPHKNKQKWRKTAANPPPKSPPELKLYGPWGLAFGRWFRR